MDKKNASPADDPHFIMLVEELRRQVRDGKLGLELVLLQLEQITNVERTTTSPLAQKARQWFENWYRILGFEITVPLPPVSDADITDRTEGGIGLFYRPPSNVVEHIRLMHAFDQENNPTILHPNYAAIGWEPTVTGYWFWTETTPVAPRKNQSWISLTTELAGTQQKLISIEEYVILWFVYKTVTNGQMIDNTGGLTFLRTKSGKHLFRACTRTGTPKFFASEKMDFMTSLEDTGGRTVEIIG